MAKKEKKIAPTTALHAEGNDGSHMVGIGDLRVVLSEEDGYWFAQGLEIDYFAQGSSLDDVKKRFETGLYATLDEYIKNLGSIEGFLIPAPSDVWTEFYLSADNDLHSYSQFTFHNHSFVPKFSSIRYFAEAS